MSADPKLEDIGRLEQIPWHTLEVDAVFRDLQVQADGLSSAEAADRLHRFGDNELKVAPRPGFWSALWDQLNNFVVILLIVSSLISALLGEWVDALAILAIVVLNTVLGIVQERRAEEALAALQRLTAPFAQVLRGGHRESISSRNLVPGNFVFMKPGNYVPADMRLLMAINLRIEEASLTGESSAVHKNAAAILNQNIPLGDWKNTAFMGTLVTYGRGRGIVTNTGMHTQLGLIARMLQNVDNEETPLQRRLDQLGRTLSLSALFLVGVVFVLALIHNTNIGELFALPFSYIQENAKEITDMFIIPPSPPIAPVPTPFPPLAPTTLPP